MPLSYLPQAGFPMFTDERELFTDVHYLLDEYAFGRVRWSCPDSVDG
jgi:hypothetical protein